MISHSASGEGQKYGPKMKDLKLRCDASPSATGRPMPRAARAEDRLPAQNYSGRRNAAPEFAALEAVQRQLQEQRGRTYAHHIHFSIHRIYALLGKMWNATTEGGEHLHQDIKLYFRNLVSPIEHCNVDFAP